MPKPKPDKENVVVRNARKGAVMVPELGMLKPGANIVKRDALERAQKKTSGCDPETGDKNGDSSWPSCVSVEDSAPTGPVGRTEPDAIKLVQDTFDLEILEQYQAEAKRPAVKRAITNQIKLMTEEPEDDDK